MQSEESFNYNHLRMSETRLLRRFRCWLEDKFQMNYTLQDINTVLFSVSVLKGTQSAGTYAH